MFLFPGEIVLPDNIGTDLQREKSSDPTHRVIKAPLPPLKKESLLNNRLFAFNGVFSKEQKDLKWDSQVVILSLLVPSFRKIENH